MNGFAVRESQSGRSSVMFSYRIVAQPYGMANRRIALADVRSFEPTKRLEGSTRRTQIPQRRAALKQGLRSRLSLLHLFVPRPNFAVETRTR
jgi:hypothetical protein